MAATTTMRDILNLTMTSVVADSVVTTEPVDLTTRHNASMSGPGVPSVKNMTLVTDQLAPDVNDTEVVIWEYKLSLLVQMYAGIVIILIGVVGNVIVIAVMTYKRDFTSTSIYLTNLGAADLTVCVIGQMCRVFPRALTGFDTAYLHPMVCKSWFFINHSAKTISGWTLVAVTIERTLVVYFPFKAKELCTNLRAKVAILLINILCMGCYLHYFWSYGPKYEVHGNDTVLVAGCTIADDFPEIMPYMLYVRPWQDFIIRSAAPFAFLLICNVLIITKLTQEHIKRKKMASGQQHAGQNDSKMRSMTAMLLTVSFAHLICISPMQIMYLIDKSDPFGWKITERWQGLVALRWAFAIDIYYANHAINFLLYCISGRDFRRQVRDMFARIPCCTRCCGGPSTRKTLSSSYASDHVSVATVATSVPENLDKSV